MDNIQPGQNLGPYRIIDQIGQGGMATVYKAYHAAMDRYVAIKVLPRQLAESPEFVGRFQQEARTIANLEHPHILPVHDYGESEGITYLVMRFLDAGTLKERLQGSAPSLAEIDRIFIQLADALAYAHDHGVVHRDLKPSNVLVDARGNLFLTDFGIAKLLEASPQFTSTGAMIGTPAYMSPEQAQGQKVDQRSDIYSLGIILYEMVTGRVPYEAETPLAVVLKHLNEPLPLPSSVKPDIPPSLERVILKALSKNPDDRFSSVAEFLTAWKEAFNRAQSEAGTVSPPLRSGDLRRSTPPAPTEPATTMAASTVPAASAPTVAAPPAARKGSMLPWIIGGVGAVIVVAAVIAVGVAILGPKIGNVVAATATRAPTSTTSVQPTSGAATPAPGETAVPATEPAAAGGLISPASPAPATAWTSWAASNDVYSSVVVGDQVIAWGAGGITVWSRADGALLRRFLPQDGLPASNVYAVLVDEEKRALWAATDEGLGFFDGKGWTIYNQDDGLDSSTTTALAWMGPDLVVGTAYSGVDGGGLMRFDGAHWEKIPDFPSAQTDEHPDKLSYNVNVLLSVMMPDASTVLWVGTENGLGRYDGQTWTSYFTEQGLPNNHIRALTIDEKGELWVGTDDGAAHFNGEAFEAVERLKGQGAVYGIVQDPEGRYWYSGDGGIGRFDPQRADWQAFTQDNGDLPVSSIFGAVRDEDGNLYFGSYGGGLIRYDGKQFTPWTVPNVPRAYRADRIILAPDGHLWFDEQYGDRVDQYDLAANTWSPVELPCESCAPLAFDSSGNLWLGGDAGAWIASPGNREVTHLTTEQGLPADAVHSLAFTQDGHVLLGTTAGVAHIEGTQVTDVFDTKTAGLASDNVRALLSASDGSIWIATDQGLSRMTADGAWEHYAGGNPFRDDLDFVTDLTEDTQGAIWAATGNDGAWRFADGEWKRFNADSLYAAAAAPDGGVWFGAYYHGVIRYDGNVWQSFGVKDGLIHPNVNDIYVAQDGTVWFATSGGVTRYTP
jgi:ligand-binding sensor domain-containing protein/tRNA A-37 threonylcarbamoyl transferase component Bud32